MRTGGPSAAAGMRHNLPGFNNIAYLDRGVREVGVPGLAAVAVVDVPGTPVAGLFELRAISPNPAASAAAFS